MAKSHRFVAPVGLVALASPPSTPEVGDTYFDTTLKRVRTWDGTNWINGSEEVLIQNDAPTPVLGLDLWVDPDTEGFKQRVPSLGELPDVDTTGVTDGQVLTYSEDGSGWVAADAASGAASSLPEIGDGEKGVFHGRWTVVENSGDYSPPVPGTVYFEYDPYEPGLVRNVLFNRTDMDGYVNPSQSALERLFPGWNDIPKLFSSQIRVNDGEWILFPPRKYFSGGTYRWEGCSISNEIEQDWVSAGSSKLHLTESTNLNAPAGSIFEIWSPGSSAQGMNLVASPDGPVWDTVFPLISHKEGNLLLTSESNGYRHGLYAGLPLVETPEYRYYKSGTSRGTVRTVSGDPAKLLIHRESLESYPYKSHEASLRALNAGDSFTFAIWANEIEINDGETHPKKNDWVSLSIQLTGPTTSLPGASILEFPIDYFEDLSKYFPENAVVKIFWKGSENSYGKFLQVVPRDNYQIYQPKYQWADPFWKGTRAEYDAIPVKDPNVLYVVKD